MSDLTDRIEQLAEYEAMQSATASAELQGVLAAVRRLERHAEPVPYKIMSPRQHYEVATRLVTAGMSEIEEQASKEGRPVTAHEMRYLTDTARVHAILATVPQAQFDAWKAGGSRHEPPTESVPNATYACHRCDRPLFTTDRSGDIELGNAAIAPGWSVQDGKVVCLDDDLNGCQGTGVRPGESIRRRWHASGFGHPAAGDMSVPDPVWHPGHLDDCDQAVCVAASASSRAQTPASPDRRCPHCDRQLLLFDGARCSGDRLPRCNQLAYERGRRGDFAVRDRRPTALPSGGAACEHGRNLTRCKACHLAGQPQTQCFTCMVACWNPDRVVGSRCDLPHCSGKMVRYVIGTAIMEAPVEVSR